LQPLGLAPLTGATAAANQFGGGFTSGNGLWDVNGIIDALAGDQLITILAEPNLTALSGETASFLAGGEFPIPIAGNTSNGQTTITVEFKTFGVSLAVVPTVLSDRRLNLRVRPEVSQLTTNGAVSVPLSGGTLTIPALTVRRAETTVELGSGQSFAIAGLLQKTTLDNTNALPWIGEVPVLGSLFKSNDFQRGESELVIIVTPYVVQPAAGPSALRTPMDGFRPATDLDRILFGRQYGPGPAGGPPLDAGFILK
jgi:pilus assembly protein CpaC